MSRFSPFRPSQSTHNARGRTTAYILRYQPTASAVAAATAKVDHFSYFAVTRHHRPSSQTRGCQVPMSVEAVSASGSKYLSKMRLQNHFFKLVAHLRWVLSSPSALPLVYLSRSPEAYLPSRREQLIDLRSRSARVLSLVSLLVPSGVNTLSCLKTLQVVTTSGRVPRLG